MNNEVDNVRIRYERRKQLPCFHGPLSHSVYMSHQEKERSIIRWIKYAGLEPIGDKKVLEVGCGSGANLLQFLKFGFVPENIVGVELLKERADSAKRMLPAGIEILCGDASEMNFGMEKFDIVVQMTVFSSLLDPDFRKKMARHMWGLIKPGGGILWYDFIYNNPKNHDVTRIPTRMIKELFPKAEIKIWHITLAPPISRLVTRIHPSLYTIFNFLPFLRTHVLCWIKKEK